MAARVFTTREICLKCVDENEVLYDEHCKYLHKVKSKPLPLPEDLNHQLLTNINTCQELLKLFLKQRILLNEPCVRFNPANDIARLQAQVDQMELTKDMKEVFRQMTESGYNFLKEEMLLRTHVEFDCTRHASVDAFGKSVKLICDYDMISLLEETNDVIDTDSVDKRPGEDGKHSDSMTDEPNAKENGNTKRSDINRAKIKRKIMTKKHSDVDNEALGNKHDDATRKKSGRALTNVCVTARNYVSAVDIFHQLISLHTLDISTFYLLVWHVGPLVESQELILYEYTPPADIVDICQSWDISCDIHIDQLENSFREIKGKQLQVLADLKTYLKYLVFDCPGVKDSLAEKKDRYERYMAKKLNKKELKRQRKIQANPERHDSTESTDSVDDGISLHESLWSTSVQTDDQSTNSD